MDQSNKIHTLYSNVVTFQFNTSLKQDTNLASKLSVRGAFLEASFSYDHHICGVRVGPFVNVWLGVPLNFAQR